MERMAILLSMQKMKVELQLGNNQQCINSLRQLQDEYSSNSEIEAILYIIEYCINVQFNNNLSILKEIHTKINQSHCPLRCVYFINMWHYLLEGNISEAILERERYANFLIKNHEKPQFFDSPFSLLIQTEKIKRCFLLLFPIG